LHTNYFHRHSGVFYYSKRNYYFKQIGENKSDSGKLWKTLKSALSLNKKGINADCIETNGKILHSKREISQGFAKYFRSAVAKIRASLSFLFFQPQSSPIQVNTSFKFSTISIDFVCNELRNIKKKQVYRIVEHASSNAQRWLSYL
jgi:hypothetical protein